MARLGDAILRRGRLRGRFVGGVIVGVIASIIPDVIVVVGVIVVVSVIVVVGVIVGVIIVGGVIGVIGRAVDIVVEELLVVQIADVVVVEDLRDTCLLTKEDVLHRSGVRDL